MQQPSHIHTTPNGTRVGSVGDAIYVSTDHGDTWTLVHGDEPKAAAATKPKKGA